MAAEKRKQNTSVKRALFEKGYRFNFFKAVNLLERFAGGRAPGESLSAGKDPVRFKVLPGFAFAASDIAGICRSLDGKPEVTVNFLGLVGPKGVLPDWYNELARQLHVKKDHRLTDFLDIFHQRLISLFYLAWKKYRLAENYRPDGSDRISSSLAELVGMDSGELNRNPEFYRFSRERLIYFSGLVAHRVPTAFTLEAVVSHIMGAKVRIEQFVPRKIPVHENDRTLLGRINGTLNKDAMCGGCIHDAGSFFTVRIGPLTWRKYLQFQPRGSNLSMICKLIERIAGMEYEFDIQLVIKGPDIPGLSLGGRSGEPLLGRTMLLRNIEKPFPLDIVVKAAASGH